MTPFLKHIVPLQLKVVQLILQIDQKFYFWDYFVSTIYSYSILLYIKAYGLTTKHIPVNTVCYIPFEMLSS